MKLALAYYAGRVKWSEISWCECRFSDAQRIADRFAEAHGYPDSILIVAAGPRYYARYVLGKDYKIFKILTFRKRINDFCDKVIDPMDQNFTKQLIVVLEQELNKLKEN